jgi:hypothetical protein
MSLPWRRPQSRVRLLCPFTLTPFLKLLFAAIDERNLNCNQFIVMPASE